MFVANSVGSCGLHGKSDGCSAPSSGNRHGRVGHLPFKSPQIGDQTLNFSYSNKSSFSEKLCSDTAGTSTEVALEKLSSQDELWHLSLRNVVNILRKKFSHKWCCQLQATAARGKRAWNEVSDQKWGFEFKFDLSSREAIYKRRMLWKEVKKMFSIPQDTG